MTMLLRTFPDSGFDQKMQLAAIPVIELAVVEAPGSVAI
jgi:hypothetical protein